MEQQRLRMRYGLYALQSTLESGEVFHRCFIVLRDEYGMIVRFTRLQDYADVYDGKNAKPLTADPAKKLSCIVSMLNYILVDHGEQFQIRSIFDITKNMLEEFFTEYALEVLPDGTYRTAATIEKCIAVVTHFMWNLTRSFAGYMKVSAEELYETRTMKTSGSGKEAKTVPAFQIIYHAYEKPILRDMPVKVLELLIPLAFRYTRDIAFALCLQAFAGLRAGEVCNVRQETSPYGAGIRITEMNGSVRKIEIDLRREYCLRSDGVSVGGIKKERLQCVYPPFFTVFMRAYELHQSYLQDRRFEKQYCPMFVNGQGKAMTYEGYRQRFHKLICEYLRPLLLKNEDPELHLYGQLLCEHSLGLHTLRHWYTVQLVLMGENIAGIQYWRGDKNPASAFQYLQNKGDLNRELYDAGCRLADMLMNTEEYRYDGKDDSLSV